ncbi:4Fe-4S dicluster domain-containing protein [Chloroflexota bacterium]
MSKDISVQYGLAFDLERCIGCSTCIIACKSENGRESGSGIRVETIGGHHRDTPAGRHPELTMHFLPVPCMHCEKPSCADVCPVSAISKREDGIVLVDSDECTGCQACIDACPYGAIIFDEEDNTVWKCTLCASRIDGGLEPFCQFCCEGEAIYFGNLLDTQSSIARVITERKAIALKSEAGTGPSVYYCPTKSGRVE